MRAHLTRARRQAATAPPLSSPSDAERRRWKERLPDGSTRLDATLARLRAPREVHEAGEPIDLRGANLVDQDLSGLDLSGADLRGADLSRAKLSDTRLLHADLRGATLFHAELARTDLTAADLSGANLEGARGERAGLGRARLQGARLIEAELAGATLTQADLAGADLRSARLRGARIREADLTGADFTHADLRDCELNGSCVRATIFDGADMHAAHLKQLSAYKLASWIGADVREVDFAGAYMTRRFILDQNYLAEFRSQGRLASAVYTLWWATSDCGRSLARWGLCTVALALLFAVAFAAVAMDYGDYATWYSPFYYSVVTLTTLGYGDVVPAGVPAQLFATVEVSLGYFMLGGLMSILSNKLARRAE